MRGKIIVIEGSSDGVGKTTQTKLLIEKLKKEGKKVEFYHFPAYNTIGAKPVEAYLQGELGPKEVLSPYLISSLYALDRAYSYQKYLKKYLEEDKIIIFDRYTTSTMFYQSIGMNLAEKENFIEWVKHYEYDLLGLPKPDIIIFLSVTEDVANRLRMKRTSKDIHEQDQQFLQKVQQNGKWLAKKEQWKIIDCLDQQGNMRKEEEISNQIFDLVMKSL